MNWLRNAKSVGFKITWGYKYFVTSCEWRKLDLLWDYLSYSVCHCKHWKQWHSQHFLQRFKDSLDTWLLIYRLHLLNHCLLPPLSLPSLFSTWLSGSKLKQRLTEQLSDLNLTLRWSCFIIQGYNFSPQPSAWWQQTTFLKTLTNFKSNGLLDKNRLCQFKEISTVHNLIHGC